MISLTPLPSCASSVSPIFSRLSLFLPHTHTHTLSLSLSLSLIFLSLPPPLSRCFNRRLSEGSSGGYSSGFSHGSGGMGGVGVGGSGWGASTAHLHDDDEDEDEIERDLALLLPTTPTSHDVKHRDLYLWRFTRIEMSTNKFVIKRDLALLLPTTPNSHSLRLRNLNLWRFTRIEMSTYKCVKSCKVSLCCFQSFRIVTERSTEIYTYEDWHIYT